MQTTERSDDASVFDRMGCFIGRLRTYENVSLKQLASGLCSMGFLCKIENGEREAGKLLVDVLFQRLGKSAEMFERIMDWSEFRQWKMRQEIAAHLENKDLPRVRRGLERYLKENGGVLDRQFAAIMEINCRHLEGCPPEELLSRIYDALRLTHPEFFISPLTDVLLSQNDGNLFFAALKLREQLEGADSVDREYRALLDYLRQPRYDRRERLYLLPYVACSVIEHDYCSGNYAAALSLCDEILDELTERRRLFAYGRLLQWKQRIFDAMGREDRTPERLLEQLRIIERKGPQRLELPVPYQEQGHVYCLNQVIRDRRRLLGKSQEELAHGVCNTATLSRIENRGGNLHRKNRKALLQRVNMSGERYDYEVITDQYEDHLLRSELDGLINKGDHVRAREILAQLGQNIPQIPTNRQYLLACEAQIRGDLPEGHPDKMTWKMRTDYIRSSLRLTLPLELDTIDAWPVCILSINELLQLISYAFLLKHQGQLQLSLSILEYARKCLENTGADLSLYEDLYTRIEMTIASALGDLGRYGEATARANACLRLSLDAQNSAHLSRCLHSMAWDLTQQLNKMNEEDRFAKEQEALSLLKSAYAAAILSGRKLTQKNIYAFCLKQYGVKLEI